MYAWGEGGKSRNSFKSTVTVNEITAVADTLAREAEASKVTVVDLDTESDAQPATPEYDRKSSDSSAEEDTDRPRTVAESRMEHIVHEAAEAIDREQTIATKGC